MRTGAASKGNSRKHFDSIESGYTDRLPTTDSRLGEANTIGYTEPGPLISTNYAPYHTSIHVNPQHHTTSNASHRKNMQKKMRFLTPLHPPSISEKLESMKNEAIKRDKEFESQMVSNERFMKMQEKTRKNRCSDQVRRHQDRAKQLWKAHTQNLEKESSPGPGHYMQEQNYFTSTFVGEGQNCSFGTEPRMPATTSHSDRVMNLKRSMRRQSVE